jgi:hypothetical protein
VDCHEDAYGLVDNRMGVDGVPQLSVLLLKTGHRGITRFVGLRPPFTGGRHHQSPHGQGLLCAFPAPKR